MALRSPQYLTLDMIELIATVPDRDRTNSRSQSVLRYRGYQLDSPMSPFTPVGHCRAARHRAVRTAMTGLSELRRALPQWLGFTPSRATLHGDAARQDICDRADA